ncbi:hypothetical protein A2661_02085 [Candidatus Giovannonibacteria bacterium RIFCSPHIGHO2_01_FULL_45_24]|uniref:Uncharacterized protein n=1 Tax=Candidatus Giovannonibacteria bacterium RIFCSPLOWO2_01_FULL_46_32 TaxID=1798353 RepID=A0A1F5XHS4_9BACT|nr:MAG: hypothetical protein A2661_02085 [Candidatus Giovannonibacteria bacterium RIFCSPHIGHO2_01_FULL_45_24]OGF87485.1 MAG: hypothetical protein A3B19_02805 [Candidatus Giovannonibacteria bacterium RIFCSPLOWO2_01_FULL_46_32]
MSEAAEKFKEIVQKADSIAVSVAPANKELNLPDNKKLLAGSILHKFFLLLGKKSALNETAPEENVLIRLDTKKLPISELKYERDGDELKIILKSAEKSPDISHVSVSKEVAPADLLVLIDPPEDEIPGLLEKTAHRDVVKLTAKEKHLAAKLAELLEIFDKKFLEEAKEDLWMLLSSEEKALVAPSQNGYLLLQKLLELGLDEEKAKKARLEKKSAFWKLLGRALARSEYEENIGTAWSFLPKADFQKTGAGQDAILEIFEEFRAEMAGAGFWALLWETSSEPKKISAVISSADHAKLAPLAGLFGVSAASSYFFANGFSAFSEAEIKIRGHIKKVL